MKNHTLLSVLGTNRRGLAPDARRGTPSGSADMTENRPLSYFAPAAAGIGLAIALAGTPLVALAGYADGTYEGSGKGIGGDVPVVVVIEDGEITSVEVGENGETQGIGSKAIEQLPDLIVEAQGVEGVEGVSGASVTSKAIFTAVEQALDEATVADEEAAVTEGTEATESAEATESTATTGGAEAAEATDESAAVGTIPANGVYTGTIEGKSGVFTVTLTIKNGEVVFAEFEAAEAASTEAGAQSTIDLQAIYDEIIAEEWSGDSSSVSPCVRIGSDGSYLRLDSNPEDVDDGDFIMALTTMLFQEDLHAKLGIPESVIERMNTTRAIDGTQTYDGNGIHVSWTYHPDNGLEAIYTID